MKEPRRGWGSIGATMLLGLFLATQVRAHTYVITDTNDSTAVTSLRGAIIAANQRGGDNTIILGEEPKRHQPVRSWTFYLTIVGGDEDSAQTGDLDVTNGNLTIIGASPNVTINASALGDRIFQVFSNVDLTLNGLVMTGGTGVGNLEILSSTYANGESGGAIYNAGTLFLRNCVISNNTGGGGNIIPRSGLVLGTSGGDGGGIYNAGSLIMENCIVSGNSAGAGTQGLGGGVGGGIKNDGTTALILCQILNNQSGGAGGQFGGLRRGGFAGNAGGIYNTGTMTLTKCTVNGNACGEASDGGTPTGTIGPFTPGGGGGNGGGIFNLGKLMIEFCTISSNACSSGGVGGTYSFGGPGGQGGSGGGVFNAGNLSMNACTISANSAGSGGNGGDGNHYGGTYGGVGGGGGGIFNSGLLNLTSCTIVSNAAGAGGNGGNGGAYDYTTYSPADGGLGGGGGGVLSAGPGVSSLVLNTLVAGNTVNEGGKPGTNGVPSTVIGAPPPLPEIGNPGASGVGPNVDGAFTSGGFNLIGAVDGSSGFVNGVGADQVGTVVAPIDPLIGPLQLNGGPTATHALSPTSPAVDRGDSFGIREDQRGRRRPYNFKGIPNAAGGDGSDIGAFELDRGDERRERD